jgi:hypothetical protein
MSVMASVYQARHAAPSNLTLPTSPRFSLTLHPIVNMSLALPLITRSPLAVKAVMVMALLALLLLPRMMDCLALTRRLLRPLVLTPIPSEMVLRMMACEALTAVHLPLKTGRMKTSFASAPRSGGLQTLKECSGLSTAI